MVEASLTERLASWLSEWRASGLPEEVLETSQGYLLDWLGSTLAGTATAPGAMLLDYAEMQPSGPCDVVGSSLSRSADVAALVNGGLSHIVEMDDVDRGSVVHPGAVVIPAALAVAERENRNGRDFLSAVVAGYEVAIRIGEAVGKRHYYYFHNTGTCGVFGAAAAAGWLLGLTEEQIVWAPGQRGHAVVRPLGVQRRRRDEQAPAHRARRRRRSSRCRPGGARLHRSAPHPRRRERALRRYRAERRS